MSFKQPFVKSHLLEALMGFDYQGWSLALYRATRAYYIIYFTGVENKIERVISIISDPSRYTLGFSEVEDIFRQHKDRLKDVMVEFAKEKASRVARGEKNWTGDVTEH